MNRLVTLDLLSTLRNGGSEAVAAQIESLIAALASAALETHPPEEAPDA